MPFAEKVDTMIKESIKEDTRQKGQIFRHLGSKNVSIVSGKNSYIRFDSKNIAKTLFPQHDFKPSYVFAPADLNAKTLRVWYKTF